MRCDECRIEFRSFAEQAKRSTCERFVKHKDCDTIGARARVAAVRAKWNQHESAQRLAQHTECTTCCSLRAPLRCCTLECRAEHARTNDEMHEPVFGMIDVGTKRVPRVIGFNPHDTSAAQSLRKRRAVSIGKHHVSACFVHAAPRSASPLLVVGSRRPTISASARGLKGFAST